VVKIYAGRPFDIPSQNLDDDTPVLTFAEMSEVKAQRIMVFSDKSIIVYGSIKNEIETRDGNQIIGECSTDYIPQDVFRCVPINTVASRTIHRRSAESVSYLTNSLILNAYNTQYNTKYESMTFVFDAMPSNYSIYIQTLKNIEMNGTIIGAKVGLCSTNLNVTGIISATQGGC